MIGKGSTVKGSAKGIAYAYNDKGHAQEVDKNMLAGDTPKEMYWEMRHTADQNQFCKNSFFSAAFSPEAKDTVTWKMEDWKKLSDNLIKKLDLQKNQYVVTLHTSTNTPHLHIYANRIDMRGKNHINQQFVGKQMHRIAAAVSKELGWKTAREVQASKSMAALPQKEQIKNHLQASIRESSSIADLNRNMLERGYSLKWNERDGNPIGLRIVPINELQQKAGLQMPQGFKLSEITRDIKIPNILSEMSHNLSRVGKLADKVKELTRKMDRGMEM